MNTLTQHWVQRWNSASRNQIVIFEGEHLDHHCCMSSCGEMMNILLTSKDHSSFSAKAFPSAEMSGKI